MKKLLITAIAITTLFACKKKDDPQIAPTATTQDIFVSYKIDGVEYTTSDTNKAGRGIFAQNYPNYILISGFSPIFQRSVTGQLLTIQAGGCIFTIVDKIISAKNYPLGYLLYTKYYKSGAHTDSVYNQIMCTCAFTDNLNSYRTDSINIGMIAISSFTDNKISGTFNFKAKKSPIAGQSDGIIKTITDGSFSLRRGNL